jgi:hypothetical protein
MKTLYLIPALLAVAVVALMLVPGLASQLAEKAHAVLLGHMARSGMVLGMADVNGRLPTEVAAGRKVLYDTQGEKSVAVCEMPSAYTAAQNDTVGTGIILKKGARLLAGVMLSNAANTASLTLAVGIRNPVTKAAIDATAIMAATAITSAATAQVNTGTKLTAGQRYVLLEDAEIYFTLAGAAPTANAAIRVEVPYLQP